jgi:hypothetical protein
MVSTKAGPPFEGSTPAETGEQLSLLSFSFCGMVMPYCRRSEVGSLRPEEIMQVKAARILRIYNGKFCKSEACLAIER